MLIFGSEFCCAENFFWLQGLEKKNLKLKKNVFKDGINCFFYDEKLIKKAKESGAKFAILAKNEDEIFFANHFGASFILFDDEKLASFGAKAAEFYLFDSKILLLIKELKNLKKAFKLGVDGVILKSFIQN